MSEKNKDISIRVKSDIKAGNEYSSLDSSSGDESKGVISDFFDYTEHLYAYRANYLPQIRFGS